MKRKNIARLIANMTTRTKIMMCALLITATVMSGCVEPDVKESTTVIWKDGAIVEPTIVPTVKPTPEAIHTPEPTVAPTPDIKDDIVIVFDISESMFSEIAINTGVTILDYEKILICNILDDKDFRDDLVGMIAFGGKAYEVAGLTYLGNDAARESLKETIMTIEPKGEITTTLDQGLAMAEEMLANSAGAKDVIVVSDGNIDAGIYESSLSVAARMNNADIRMHFIHVMSSPTNLVTKFEDLAHGVDSTYQQTTYPASVAISTSQATATHSLSPPSPDPIPVSTSAFTELEPEPDPHTEIGSEPEIEPIQTLPSSHCISAIVDRSPWDNNIIYFLCINGEIAERALYLDPMDYKYLDYIEIFIDNQLIASFEPTVVKGNIGFKIEEFPMIIKLPNGIDNSGEITMIGTFTFSRSPHGLGSIIPDGDYHIIVCHRGRVPDEYQDEYNEFPIYQG